ncbi:pyridoxamine 5'-phosphate oxidase family protein [bacterium]|nr:pyridoxamine 5'-phosphate oxidase family protein [candidate division CSSED10-310 bacterium]
MQQYHLRRSEKSIVSQTEIVSILKRNKWLTLGLCNDGEPYVVTLNYGFASNTNSLYMHCATHGHKLDIIRQNNLACASIVEDLGYKIGECDHAFRSIVIHGIVVPVKDSSEKILALKTMIRHLEPDPDPVIGRFFKQGFDDTGLEILRLDIKRIVGKQNL